MVGKELRGLLGNLVAMKTTADRPAELKRCASFIASYLRAAGANVRLHESNGTYSVVATLRKTKKPKIFLNAHFDVVPAAEGMFTPRVAGGKLRGRGALDCKAQIAILMLLMKEFAALPKSRQPDIGVMLTGDEEVGGANGVKQLLERDGYGCEFAVVADAGENLDIVTRHKGLLHLKLSAKGKSAHGSMPWEGDNAADALIDSYMKIRALFPTAAELRTGSVHKRWTATMNLGKFNAGAAVNQVPGSGEMLLDVRYTEKETVNGLLRKVRGCCGKSVTVAVVHSALLLNTDSDNGYIQKLKVAGEKTLGRPVKFGSEYGSTDARYFAAKGFPVAIIWSVGKGAHSGEEYVELESVKQLHDVLKNFLATV